MKELDLILRGGTVITHDEERVADIGVAEGRIVALGSQLKASACEVIDATGLHIFPGVIDAHVHFNEPGRADWEGIETGSRALAAGGGTMFFDMPLNAHPPTIDAESFDLKLAAAKKSSLTDFAFWGGLVPQNLDKLEELAQRGVIGFKAFMSDSGIDDFSCVDDTTLREGMKRAAKLKLPVAVHAENETMTKQLAQERISRCKTSIRDYLDSRPVAAELDAIRRALDMAGETGCALHIVHVSSGEGVALVAAAKRIGVDVSCETCPHYLSLTEDDLEKIGALAKCAPPLRPRNEQEKLWRHLLAGEVTTVGSDHSPSPPEMKTDSNFFKVWGGISGAQHLLSLLITGALANLLPLPATQERGEGRGEGQPDKNDLLSPALSSFGGGEGETSQRRETMLLIAKLTSFNVASRFKLPTTKGRIVVGCDADFALVNLNEPFKVRTEDLFYRHKQTPYAGRTLRGKVVRTILRGRTIFSDGKIVAKASGNLVKPVR